MKRTIEPMSLSQAELMMEYFLSADDDFLLNMGADPGKLPQADDWRRLLQEDFSRPLPSKQFYYIAWLLDDVPIGHSNINKIVFGQEAFVHLHIWKPEHRQSGCASFYLDQSIAKYFELFDLKKLCCEPFADNPAPHKVLQRVGFHLIRSYQTTPGWINFPQRVHRWELQRPAR